MKLNLHPIIFGGSHVVMFACLLVGLPGLAQAAACDVDDDGDVDRIDIKKLLSPAIPLLADRTIHATLTGTVKLPWPIPVFAYVGVVCQIVKSLVTMHLHRSMIRAEANRKAKHKFRAHL